MTDQSHQQQELEHLRRRVAELEASCGAAPSEQVERQLRLLDTALSHTPDATYIFDRNARLLYANRTLLSRWGLSLDQALGKTLPELGYPAHIGESLIRQIEQVWQTAKPLRDQVSLQIFTLEMRHFEYIFVPVFGTSGEVDAVAGSTRDMTENHRVQTELVQANRELTHAREQLTNIFESITDAFFALDLDWRFTHLNRQAEKILSRHRQEVIGNTVWEELSFGPDTLFRLHLQRAMAEQVPVEFEEFYAPLNAWLEVRAFPSPSGVAVYFHDITARKLATEQLNQQREELTRINSDLEHFAYAAAHDLQEPLRMVSIFSQKLQRKYVGQLDAEAQEYIRIAVQSALRMEMLVRDLLAYTHAVGSHDSLLKPVAAEDVFAQSVASLRVVIERAGAVVTHEPLPPVTVLEAHLQQIFQNLLSNAIKYRRADPPRIHVSASRGNSTADSNHYRFSISDNGIGIDNQYREQIFGVFKRLHSYEEYDGTGIGLAICQKIVKRYGGEIWVESRPGVGSTFFFTLPR